MARLIALLRAVNVGGRKLPMGQLRALCTDLGWEDVRTYIQSGNIVFAASGKPEALETELEAAIERIFGLEVPVIVRTRRQWASLAKANPFPVAARAEPSRLQLLVSKKPPRADAAATLAARAEAGEKVEAAGGGVWLHYPEGVSRSKLTPASVDRAIGSPATARNYRTVARLLEMLDDS